MTPSRWTEINELFNALVDRTPEERKLVLDDIRARDPQLVETVEALLEQTAASWAVVRKKEESREAEPPPYSGLQPGELDQLIADLEPISATLDAAHSR